MDKVHSGPGKSYRKGISLIEAAQKFGNDVEAEQWLVARRWPNGIVCIQCGSLNVKVRKSARQTPTYHCNDCKKDFTVKTGTIMHDSRLPLSKWAMAFYLFSTNLKGVSSMKLHRDLGITQKAAWHMAHRIRNTYYNVTEPFAGPVEIDETYIGGKERNKHSGKKLRAGRGAVGKTAVVGAKDQDTGQVHAQPIAFTNRAALQGYAMSHSEPGSAVFTDEASAYEGMSQRLHRTVRHGTGEYVRKQATTNGIESFWALMKRGLDGTYHHVSVKHLERYVGEFSGRHNTRPLNTIDQMGVMVDGGIGKRLRYEDLIA